MKGPFSIPVEQVPLDKEQAFETLMRVLDQIKGPVCIDKTLPLPKEFHMQFSDDNTQHTYWVK